MTFYRLPKAPIVQRWVLETPADFVFAVKVSRYVTHIKRLADVHEHLPLLLERLSPLLRTPKLGPLLWQLPPTYQRDLERLEATLAYTQHDPYRHAFEFRHPSWFCKETYELLRTRNAALVIGDRPQVNDFQAHELTADFTFVRFHGGTRGANGNYSHAELDEWAGRLATWSEQVDVFAYFNNDWEGYAIENALYLKRRLGQETSAAADLLALANAAAAQG
jgi:uncharacterized protein YecE (DUF72 family)